MLGPCLAPSCLFVIFCPHLVHSHGTGAQQLRRRAAQLDTKDDLFQKPASCGPVSHATDWGVVAAPKPSSYLAHRSDHLRFFRGRSCQVHRAHGPRPGVHRFRGGQQLPTTKAQKPSDAHS